MGRRTVPRKSLASSAAASAAAASLGTNDTFVSSDLFAIPDLQVEIMTMGLDFYVSGPGAPAVVAHLRADGFDGGVVHGAVQGAVRVR